MDADTRTLIERTRQRREQLNQRFAGMPEAAPRKRRTPVLEQDGTEKPITSKADQDDSPKRQCLRDVELNIKQDTPAIKGVQSRVKDLKWEGNTEENMDGDMPTPKPRKSVSSPPLERRNVSSPRASPVKSTATPSAGVSSARKTRFAALAQSINNWEDDLTHHIVHKEEEKKPRWQPPQKADERTPSSNKGPAPTSPFVSKSVASPVRASTTLADKAALCSPRSPATGLHARFNTGSPAKHGIDSSKKSTAGANVPSTAVKASPAKSALMSESNDAVSSPKKTVAPSAPPLARNSPLRSSKVEWNRSPKPFSPAYMDNAVSPSKSVIKPVTPVLASPKALTQQKVTNSERTVKPPPPPTLPKTPASLPVNAPGLFETPPDGQLNTYGEEPTSQPVSRRFASWAHKTESPEPSKQPVSAKLANFERKIESQMTPRIGGMARSVQIPKTPKQVEPPSLSASTPARTNVASTNKAVSSVARDVDPVELPLSQRMSQMQQKLEKKRQDEPTAYSVGARMSAWEDMTAANKVSYIKKVDPGQSTPLSAKKTRPASSVISSTAAPNMTPKPASAPVPLVVDSVNPPPPPPLIPGSNNLKPSKSFKDSIEEKAAEVSKRTGLQYNGGSPKKSTKTPAVTHSPSKVSAGTRGVQQILAGKIQESGTSCSQLAAESRAARAAELAALSNRWKNGILREDDDTATASSSDDGNQGQAPKTPSNNARNNKREQARADFKGKLAELGLDETNTNGPTKTESAVCPPKTDSVKSNTASIYNLIKKRDAATPTKQSEDSKKVKFNDSFDDSEDEEERKVPKSASKRLNTECTPESSDTNDSTFKKPADHPTKEVEEKLYDSNSESVISGRDSMEVTDDDISLRGFVSEAVRRESIIAKHHRYQKQVSRDSQASTSSLDSYGESDRTTHDSMEDLASGSMTASSSLKGGYRPENESMDDDEEDDSTKRQAVNDLLDDALDDTTTADNDYDPDMDVNNVVMRKKQPRREEIDEDDPLMDINNVVMRKKTRQPPANKYMYSNMVDSTEDDDDDRPYSLQAYRKSASVQQHMMAPVIRSSKYVGKPVVEEDVAMPTSVPKQRVDDRRAVQERIRELKELVQQEQSVIMQTSNALNKCCVGNPVFAGSSEQVECNRLLLIACQKRQCYMTEIERLKATAHLSPEGPGPRGSITISDIRLPLKKDFVTKIGTSHDTTTHFFILLIRNGAQLICTQMLSTHDSMMRGSLDFPNLIKINGISSSFKLTMDIYGMSVSREASKDKKKKTPKKSKGFPLESPGGPSAVRTTSFSHVTSVELTKKSLDKSSFHLDRLPYLSPLYGQIFMRLKCLMESNVEERGFLTMFDDVSGFGAWHRRWCVLTGNKLCIWKYPDDETRKDPMAVLDLKRCVSDKIGLVSRDICARPNTFELVTVRQPLKGEQDTLVTRTYNSTTSVRHLMSADSKEERIVWCNKINRTLANLRTWNADALKPMRPPAASSSRR